MSNATPTLTSEGLHINEAKVLQLMQGALLDKVFPGAVLHVSSRGNVLFEQAFGVRSNSDEVGCEEVIPSTVYDVAALSQVVVTCTLVMLLLESKQLDLGDKVTRYVPGFGVYDKSGVTIGDLLAHTSGLPAWAPFFEELVELNSKNRLGILASRAAKDFVYDRIHKIRLKSKTREKEAYSDLGFILLGEIVEILTGYTLDRAAYHYIFKPMGMKMSSFIDLSMMRRRGIHPVTNLIAPTENCSWRKHVLCGEVHDDNAWAMGGIAGHAGLFTTVEDLRRFCSVIIDAYHGRSPYLKRGTVKRFLCSETNHDCADGKRKFADSMFTLGWEKPSKENGLDGSRLSSDAIGRIGFTGCSLWIEPEMEVAIILLSNRVHPSRSNKKIQNFRRTLLDEVLSGISEKLTSS